MSNDRPHVPSFFSFFSKKMVIAYFREDAWQSYEIKDLQPLPLHPAAHVLHLASCIFEGLKAHRSVDDAIHIFRLDRHVQRMQNSAKALALPVPDAEQMKEMICKLVDANRDDVPPAPRSLYVRPMLIGTSPIVAGSMTPSKEACLYALTGPAGDLFAGGARPLRIVVDGEHDRGAGQLGSAKAGANYAAGLGPLLDAKRKHGADQVLFSPHGIVHEAGGAGFILIKAGQIMAKAVDDSILPSVTRDSIDTLAPELGYRVTEQDFTIDEMLQWVLEGEAALCGTAAVLSGIGTLIYQEKEYRVGNGEVGPHTMRLRQALTDLHTGQVPDVHGWLTRV